MTRNEFLEKLSELKDQFKWQVDNKLHLRAYNEKDMCFCPITAVFYAQTGKFVDLMEVDVAWKEMELRSDTADKIIRAADCETNHLDQGPDWNFRYEMMDRLGFE